MVNLANAAVFLDFDGTITESDVGVHLLERLGDPDWRQVEDLYFSGAIGSRECLEREWALLPRDEAALRRVAAEVPLDAGLGDLVRDLRDAGAEVTVVSDGFGFYVADAVAPFALEVLTNEVDFGTGRMEFPNLDRCCPCSTCGTCKQAPIKDAQRRGRHAVFVGDGASDRKAALLADVLFAKGELADWCEEADVAFTPFGRLRDVGLALGLRR